MTDSRFINPGALVTSVPLQHPIEYKGVVYNEILLKKLTAGEIKTFVRDFNDQRKADPEATPHFPIYINAAGAQLPPELLDALEGDDFDAVDTAAAFILPRRFRPDPAGPVDPTASIAPTGEAGSPISSE